MPKIQLDLTKEQNKKLRVYMIEHEIEKKTEAIGQIIDSLNIKIIEK